MVAPSWPWPRRARETLRAPMTGNISGTGMPVRWPCRQAFPRCSRNTNGRKSAGRAPSSTLAPAGAAVSATHNRVGRVGLWMAGYTAEVVARLILHGGGPSRSGTAWRAAGDRADPRQRASGYTLAISTTRFAGWVSARGGLLRGRRECRRCAMGHALASGVRVIHDLFTLRGGCGSANVCRRSGHVAWVVGSQTTVLARLCLERGPKQRAHHCGHRGHRHRLVSGLLGHAPRV